MQRATRLASTGRVAYPNVVLFDVRVGTWTLEGRLPHVWRLSRRGRARPDPASTGLAHPFPMRKRRVPCPSRVFARGAGLLEASA
jgi:hypothetical protein